MMEKKQLIVPQEVASTNIKPNPVLQSGKQWVVHMVELTVPMEDAIEMTYEGKNIGLYSCLNFHRYRFLQIQTAGSRWKSGAWLEIKGLLGGGWLLVCCWHIPVNSTGYKKAKPKGEIHLWSVPKSQRGDSSAL